MSDDEYADFLQRLDEMQRRYDAGVIDSLEGSFRASPDATDVPMPMDWHPAYRDRERIDVLWDWLNEQGPYGDRDQVWVLPPTQRKQWLALDAGSPIEPSLAPIALSRRRCAGWAPFVGRPFVYEWWACVDNQGRAVAGDSRRTYTD